MGAAGNRRHQATPIAVAGAGGGRQAAPAGPPAPAGAAELQDPVAWWCEIPRAEGKWLAGPDGPLPGGATWAVGILTLTHEAFRLLEHRGHIGGEDGRITWNGSGVPVLHAGGAVYEVVACLSPGV